MISMHEGSSARGLRQFPAALLLPGDAFDTDQLQVLGRRVAGKSLVKGLTTF